MYMNDAPVAAETMGLFQISQGARLNPNMRDWLGDAPLDELSRILSTIHHNGRSIEVIDLNHLDERSHKILASFQLEAHRITGQRAKVASQNGLYVINNQNKDFRYYKS